MSPSRNLATSAFAVLVAALAVPSAPAAAVELWDLVSCPDATEVLLGPDPTTGVSTFVHAFCDGATPAVGGPLGGVCLSSAYALLPWEWSSPFDVVVDPSGSGLAAGDVELAYDASGTSWDLVTLTPIWGGVALGGSGSSAGRFDGVNQVGWKRLSAGVIAVTITWFGGGQAAESDAAYNTAFAWGVDGAADAMDLQNIATHEIGHSFGLDHPPSTFANACLTMYAYADVGETQKRVLGVGDVLGIRAKHP